MVVAQVGVIATLMGIDAWRKRVRPRSNKFPRVEPIDVDVHDSTTTIYTFGEDLYADMLAAIRGAKRKVLFESYIVKNDSLGEEFKQALIEAAERGVAVHVVYDGFANLVVPRKFFDFPPSVHVIRYPALRVGLLLLNVRKSGRDHRKILVVDGEVGFVGGYNVGALYATQWRDTHLRVRGAATWELENAFVDLWNRLRAPEQPLLDDPGTSVWEPRIRTQRNVPEQLTYPIRGMYLEAIDRAQHHIYVTQAYFIPDRDILEGLLKAARARCRGLHPGAGGLQPRGRRLAVPWLLRHVAAQRGAAVVVPARDGARQDGHHRRPLEHDRDGQHRPAEPDRQLRDQPGDHRRRVRGRDGAGVRERPLERATARAGRVVRAADRGEGERAGPGSAATAAVTRRHGASAGAAAPVCSES